MVGFLEVFAGVLARARVTASDVPAGQAHAQMSPGVFAVFFAFLAAPRRARLGFGGIARHLEVFTRVGDLRGAYGAPA